jgi:ribosomal protein S18 acetylase RimI-like enzyme
MDLSFRPATWADIDHIISILLDDPAPDMRAVVPDRRKTRTVGELLARHGLLVGIDECELALLDGQPVGVMETLRSQSTRSLGLGDSLHVIARAIGDAGPGVLFRYLRLNRARSRMAIKCPPGEFDLNELDVHPKYRNRGIGGRLLRHAEEVARAKGFDNLCLTTEIDNPARRLYERSGLHVVRSATDAVYEQMTGSPGRVLMRKPLFSRGDHGAEPTVNGRT